MSESGVEVSRSAAFAAIADTLASGRLRDEFSLTSLTPPEGIAPEAAAFAIDVHPARHGTDSELGTGRFIALYDSTEPDVWGGPLRIVCFAQAPVEVDVGSDSLLADVAWSWLIESLADADARFANASGTATTILSSGYGELSGSERGAQLELRASWSPMPAVETAQPWDLSAHWDAWCEFLGLLTGLPPAEADVPTLRDQRLQRGS